MGEGLPRVAVVGDFRFPFGDAASNRILALAQALREGGFTPVVISRGKPRPEDRAEAGRYFIDGIEYVSYADLPEETFRQRLDRPIRAIEDAKRESGLAAVLIYASASWPFVPGLIQFCRRNRLPLAADVVEWYGPRQFPHGVMDARYYLFSLCFRVYFQRIRSMVVISRLLEEYFTHKGCHTVRIPALVDCASTPHAESACGNKLRLLYAGSPGRKDLIGRALNGLLLLSDKELQSVKFTLLGPTEGQLARYFGGAVPERLRGVVQARGRVTVREVSQELLRTDFTVLLRENRKFARAGFPSKVPESLAHGVPVLCNMTGDMALYLADGRECVEAFGPTSEDFAAALRRALALSPESLRDMKLAARRCAEENFDYRNYVAALKGVVESACADASLRNTK
jgi:glycosyltransferase involved in cell wall biosynthesis